MSPAVLPSRPTAQPPVRPSLGTAPELGGEFVEYFHRAARGELGPFILVFEGSVLDERNKAEGYWATFGTDAVTPQPITTSSWIDRLIVAAPGRGRVTLTSAHPDRT